MGYSLRYRRRFLPRTLTDLSALVFMSVVIPAVYWFEVYVVAPTVYNQPLNILHTILGTYIVINIFGNFIAIIVVNTSTQGLLLPAQCVSAGTPGWHVCASCESTAPPRSRHCNTCRVCVLKKEHHCVFAGCCVGLANHRYFFIFLCLIYFFIFLCLMWVSTLYCSFLNACLSGPMWAASTCGQWFAWCCRRVAGVGAVPRHPLRLPLLHQRDGCLFMSVLVYYYTALLLTNTTTLENNTGKGNKHDHGRDYNLKVTLGERWYLTWVFPTLYSPLPCDGLEWSQRPAKTDKHKGK
ncbi:putative palmitoyltransferase ZDHHC24 [Chionoecetes opilio]|uniref:Palmitoyltransferase n=1 Tax=Chionoecetes opilio TaxID=41210 RepID=A0A8J4XQH5_CHIOP|nr:putative palmitoyltransferase ZDHHC24 [Chionoecetes opilio]